MLISYNQFRRRKSPTALKAAKLLFVSHFLLCQLNFGCIFLINEFDQFFLKHGNVLHTMKLQSRNDVYLFDVADERYLERKVIEK